MPDANPDVQDFLLTRRSHPAKTLRAPAPTPSELRPILTAAARTPDHGKLVPWRFIVLQKPALNRLADLAEARAPHLDIDPDKIPKGVSQYRDSHLAVIVVFSPQVSDKVPHSEQLYSAGAVCLSLLNAALAAGWGASWLSGWASHDREFVTTGLGLSDTETVAGFIAIGTRSCTPPERPRPDIDDITTWQDT